MRRPAALRARLAGFTLIEMAAVVLVIALIYGFVLPNFGIGSRRVLESDASSLRASLELARQRSIATGAPHRVAIDLDESRYHVEGFETPEPEAEEDAEDRERDEALALLAPPAVTGSFLPIAHRLGRGTGLGEGIYFARVETAEGIQQQGIVGVEFAQDGSATPAIIALANGDGDGLALEVLPLADTVRVSVLP